MPITLRVLLILGAALAVWIVIGRIKKSKILMDDAIFWVVAAVVLLVPAVFPQIVIFCSNLLGFMSPSNFVFLVIVALLLMKVHSDSCEISLLKHKVEELAQEIALGDERTRPADKGTPSDSRPH